MLSVSLLVAVGVVGAVGAVALVKAVAIAQDAEANCPKECILEEMFAA